MPRKYAENEAEHIIRAIVNEAEGGAIHADDVLNAAAENPNHPLHDFFEWDDPTAARQHRLDALDALLSEVMSGGMPLLVRIPENGE